MMGFNGQDTIDYTLDVDVAENSTAVDQTTVNGVCSQVLVHAVNDAVVSHSTGSCGQ